jgi:hypothetical protein
VVAGDLDVVDEGFVEALAFPRTALGGDRANVLPDQVQQVRLTALLWLLLDALARGREPS